jgi:DNA-binding transcriptional LysR family regulator
MDAQPDWNDLRVFLAVARGGSFTAAAGVVGLHHTTVARRIEQLEASLATRLFDRLARGTRLTPAGEALAGPASRVEEELLAAVRTVAGHDLQLSGRVTITAPADFLPWLLPVLGRFGEQYPAVDVVLDASSSLRDLARREADVALRAGSQAPDDAVAFAVAPLAWAVYGHPGVEGWVRYGDAPAFRPVERWRERYAEGPTVLTVTSVEAAVAAVRAGVGRALLPCVTAEGDPALQRHTDPIDELRSTVWLLVHSDLRRTARVRALVELLRDAVAELRPRLAGERP